MTQKTKSPRKLAAGSKASNSNSSNLDRTDDSPTRLSPSRRLGDRLDSDDVKGREEDSDNADTKQKTWAENKRAAAATSQDILETVYDFYTVDAGSGLGLVELASKYPEDVGSSDGSAQVIAPKKKIWVVLIGNHSAGKSSFINWYVEQAVQKTSVAIETTGFTFITSGKTRETFNGPATLQLFPFLRDVAEIKGVVPSLSTEIVPSSVKNFALITLVDTPGLVDGEMQYSFDPEDSMLRLAGHADLIFTFFDPIGQALCARTMRTVEKLCDREGHKMHFFLSKADTVPDETDRQRVLVQIAQNLTHRIKDRQFSLNIPPIYIPTTEPVPVRNHLHLVMATIDKTINMSVQNSLEMLEADCKKLSKRVQKRLRDDDSARAFNSRDFGRGCLLLTLAFAPVAVVVAMLVVRLEVFDKNQVEALKVLEAVDQWVTNLTYEVIGYIVGGSVVALFLWWAFIKKRKVLSASERALMNKHLKTLTEDLPRIHKELYQDYFDAHMEDDSVSVDSAGEGKET